MNQHVAAVLRRLVAVYGEPQAVDTKILFAEFDKALGGFRSDILDKGVDRVIKDRAFPTWPTVGEVVKACRDVSDELADRVPNKFTDYGPKKAGNPELAKQLMDKFTAGMNGKNNFNGIMRRARQWARHHQCKVTTDVSAKFGHEVVDQFGRVVPIGWKIGDGP